MYIGKGIPTTIHDHHAIQLIINATGSFILKSKNKDILNIRAVLVDSDVQHECINNDDIMLILNMAETID
jgi:hypothetical protein